MPNAGTPRAESRSNALGNSPSFAAASGISAQIMVQPLSAPKPGDDDGERHQVAGPGAAEDRVGRDEYGAVGVRPAATVGRMPNTAISDSRYTTALASVPKMVARGTLRSGSRTLAAATAAVSTPR